MKRTMVLATLVCLALTSAAAMAADLHVRAPLNPIERSGVSGVVDLNEMPQGETRVQARVEGLVAGTIYGVFYHMGSTDCSDPGTLVGTFTARPNGTGSIQEKIAQELDQLGSISVKTGPDFATVVACGAVR